jgi:hypothetical protein
MAQIVFIREIRGNTFLHLSTRGQAFRLRDYSRSAHGKPIEVMRQRPGCTTDTITEMVHREGNMLQDAPAIDWEQTKFWHDHIMALNAEHAEHFGGGAGDGRAGDGRADGAAGDGGGIGLTEDARSLDRFRQEVYGPISENSLPNLRMVMDRWLQGLSRAEDKEHVFNHWCNDSCGHLIEARTGIGWTAGLLEHCRQGHQLQFVQTLGPHTDFALLSMDLNLGISSQKNILRPGYRDYIKPDGLAVRQDGTVAVLEVKGPGDESDPVRCILQAVCGALAVYAKRDVLARIAHTCAAKRPAASQFRIPADEPSIGVYVLISSNNFAIGSVGPLRRLSNLLFAAFPPLRDIVLFSVDPNDGRFPNVVEYDLGFRKGAETLPGAIREGTVLF